MSKKTDKLDRDYCIGHPVRLLSLEGACRYLSCSGDLLEELIAIGDIPVIRLGRKPNGAKDRRKRWVDRVDLDQFIEERKEQNLNAAWLYEARMEKVKKLEGNLTYEQGKNR